MFNMPRFPDSDTWLEQRGTCHIAYLHHLRRKTQSEKVTYRILSPENQWTGAEVFIGGFFLYDSGWQGCFPSIRFKQITVDDMRSGDDEEVNKSYREIV